MDSLWGGKHDKIIMCSRYSKMLLHKSVQQKADDSVCSRTAYSALEPQCPQSTTSKVALHEVKVRGGQQREDLQRLLGHTQCQVADTVCV